MRLLSKIWARWGVDGAKLPHAFDAASKKPSARLFWAYIAFIIASSSVIALHFKASLAVATWTAIGFFVVCTVLFMLKDLTKAKFDLDDHSVDLESGTEDTAEKTKTN